jgi:type II secretory pathway component PulC
LARPLRVPLRGPLQRPGPVAPSIGSAISGSLGQPASPPFSNPEPTPELVGVVQASGRGRSAIFSLEGNSTSTTVGEAIGSTGWRLHSASGDSVVIERNGQQQRVSIGGSP